MVTSSVNVTITQRGCGFDGICSMIDKLICPANNGTCNCKFCNQNKCNDDSSNASDSFHLYNHFLMHFLTFLIFGYSFASSSY